MTRRQTRQPPDHRVTRRAVMLVGSVAGGAALAPLAFVSAARSAGLAPESAPLPSLRAVPVSQSQPPGIPPISDRLPPPDWSALEAGPQVEIGAVVDGDTVELLRGPDVRLVGTQAPKLPLGRDHVEEWPLAQEAKEALEAVLARHGRQAQLFFGGRVRDRHGRHLAHVRLADGTWLQGAMVLMGLARVYTFADNRSLIRPLLFREQLARGEARGIWSHPYYAVRQARDVAGLLQRVNHFELVEGVVLNVARHDRLWYLNFGRSWREDFTITIDREHDPVFEDSAVDLMALEGAGLRVRGWIMDEGGPLIRVDHPEPMELLTAGR